jgi:hypothetical protein
MTVSPALTFNPQRPPTRTGSGSKILANDFGKRTAVRA